MKTGVVMSSTLTKHRRWDVGYYLGQVSNAQAELTKAKAQVRKANTRLKNCRALLKKAEVKQAEIAKDITNNYG